MVHGQRKLSHPIDREGRWKYIVENAVIKMPSFNGDQLFRVKKRKKSDSGVTATLEPIFLWLHGWLLAGRYQADRKKRAGSARYYADSKQQIYWTIRYHKSCDSILSEYEFSWSIELEMLTKASWTDGAAKYSTIISRLSSMNELAVTMGWN